MPAGIWSARRKALYLGAAALTLGLGLPVLAQRGPTSLLPPGFGDAPAEEPAIEEPTPQSPQQAGVKPGLQLDLGAAAEPDVATNASAIAEELTPEELAAQQAKYDLPDTARRSLDRIGPLTPESGGFAPDAFGRTSGQFLATLMRENRAPFVSRWASILLRRVLLSATDTPGDIDGADWAAERAWLLVRMGEADAARMIVQSVDTDRYTPRLDSVAMQAYLASADPSGLCPLQARAAAQDSSQGWKMAEAICASFSGEQGTASAVLNQAERRSNVSDIDYHLTEKIVGAGLNARRSVKIEWDGVDSLTAWRYGMATAANVDIPAPLMAAAGPRVLAWQARAPMLSLQSRLPGVEMAARLGVFSSAALVDFYSQLAASDTQPDGFDQRATALTNAYAAVEPSARIDAMRQLCVTGSGFDFLGLLSVAKAAAALPVVDAGGADISGLIAAMLSAGYDNSAARWAQMTQQLDGGEGATGWALLAVGAPRVVVDVSAARTASYAEDNGVRGQMLLAGLTGLGRLSVGEASKIGADTGVSFTRRSRWSNAIGTAARRGEKGTVALLAAIGMQTGAWSRLPPEHLYHIVAALHQVGLDGEARMIAAEAIMRT